MRSREEQNISANLVPGSLPHRLLLDVLHIPHEPGKPRALEDLVRLLPVALGVLAHVYAQQQERAREEGRERHVRDGERVADSEAGGREERLDRLEAREERVHRAADEDELAEAVDDLRVHDRDEEARLVAQDGVRGQEARGGEEVGEEL